MNCVLTKNIDQIGWISDEESDAIVTEIISYFSDKSRSAYFVGYAVWETMQPNARLQKLVLRLKEHDIKTILIFESTVENSSWLDPVIAECEEVLFVPFWAYLTYHELVIKKPWQQNPSWNPAGTKLLYFTGTLRYSRARLFYRLHSEGLLDHTIWSLFVPTNPDHVDPSWIPEIDPDKVYTFLKNHEGTPDEQEDVVHDDGTKTVRNALRSDPQVYNQSKFRLIAETDADAVGSPLPARITEKTWFTIANRLPFMILGKKRSLRTLKKLDIKTFEDYLPISDYDSFVDVNDRIEAVITNARHWLDGDIPIDEINQDVEYNYQQFIMIATRTTEKLENLIQKYNLEISRENLLSSEHNLYP